METGQGGPGSETHQGAELDAGCPESKSPLFRKRFNRRQARGALLSEPAAPGRFCVEHQALGNPVQQSGCEGTPSQLPHILTSCFIYRQAVPKD